MPPPHHVALDGWRGVAALMIAVYHFQAVSTPRHTQFLHNAWLFVDLFFVLSGFVIAANYRHRLADGFGVGRFLMLRMGRLYPLHVLVLLSFVATETVLAVAGNQLPGSGRDHFTGQTEPIGILTSLLLIQGIGFSDGQTWNHVAWSISTEMWAYVVFAWLAVHYAKRLELAMLALIAVTIAFVLPEQLRPTGIHRFVDFARCLYGFALGVLLQSLYARLSEPSVSSNAPANAISSATFTLLELAALVVAIAFVQFAPHLPAHLLAPLAFAPTVFIYAFDRGLISRILQTRFFVLLGLLSYSIYMIHPFLQSRIMLPIGLALQKVSGLPLLHHNESISKFEFVWGRQEWEGNLATVIMLALLLTASHVTYHLIEAPGRDAIRRFVSQRPVAA